MNFNSEKKEDIEKEQRREKKRKPVASQYM
jgi:hypothetical protein